MSVAVHKKIEICLWHLLLITLSDNLIKILWQDKLKNAKHDLSFSDVTPTPAKWRHGERRARQPQGADVTPKHPRGIVTLIERINSGTTTSLQNEFVPNCFSVEASSVCYKTFWEEI